MRAVNDLVAGSLNPAIGRCAVAVEQRVVLRFGKGLAELGRQECGHVDDRVLDQLATAPG